MSTATLTVVSCTITRLPCVFCFLFFLGSRFFLTPFDFDFFHFFFLFLRQLMVPGRRFKEDLTEASTSIEPTQNTRAGLDFHPESTG